TYTVSQDGFTCSYVLSPIGTNLAADAALGSFNVITTSGCEWSAATTDTWIHTSSTGSTSGPVDYSVDANPDFASRGGAITVQGHSFAVTQASAACTYALSSTNLSVSAAATNGTVDVTTTTNCDWSASSNVGWITIDSATNGTGNGTVAFSVDVNPATA